MKTLHTAKQRAHADITHMEEETEHVKYRYTASEHLHPYRPSSCLQIEEKESDQLHMNLNLVR